MHLASRMLIRGGPNTLGSQAIAEHHLATMPIFATGRLTHSDARLPLHLHRFLKRSNPSSCPSCHHTRAFWWMHAGAPQLSTHPTKHFTPARLTDHKYCVYSRHRRLKLLYMQETCETTGYW